MTRQKLTIKQKRFADEYIISGNATEAARKAGYSKNTARETGYENLTKPHIKEYIDERLEKLEAAKYLTMDEALQITASIARGEGKVVKDTTADGMLIDKLVYPSFRDQRDALEHFYKLNGGFTENYDVNLSVPVFLDDVGEKDDL